MWHYNHEVEAGVWSEGLVSRSEPAKEGEWDEEEGVDEGQPEHGSIIQPSEEKASPSKQISDKQRSVDWKKNNI